MNPILYLVLPPMSRTGDIEAERGVIKKFAAFGLKTKISDEDAKLYRMSGVKDKDYDEYINIATEYIKTSGKHNKNKRKRLNELQRLLDAGEIEIIKSCDKHDMSGINELYENWLAYKGKKRSEAISHQFFNKTASETESCLIEIRNKEFTEIFAIFEKLSDGQYAYVQEIRNYGETVLKDPSKLMHYLTIKETNGGNINKGNGIIQGLISHKEQCKPDIKLQIFNTFVEKNLSKEVWENAITP